MTLKENLQTIRKINHLSQEKLAAKIGVSRQSISKWENGEAYPTTANMIAICSVLHCKITDLIDVNSEECSSFDHKTKKEIIALTQKDQKRLQKTSKVIYILARIIRYLTLFGFVIIGLSIYASRYVFLNYMFSDLPAEITMGELSFVNYFRFGIVIKAAFIIFVIVLYVLATLLIYLTLRETEHFFQRISNQQSPFSLENTLSLKKISKYLLLWILVSTATNLMLSITGLSHKASINLPVIFFALITICFIYIFQYGQLLESSKK